eukprot:gene28151-37050_t
MNSKISAIQKRRGFIPWNDKNQNAHKASALHNITHFDRRGKFHGSKQRPNILLLLAGGILTPQLERMAKNGAIMTNFHASAPVCSPSRASIMTGLYPWRLTAMNAFELGRDLTQRNGFLPQVPTVAEILREVGGYYTAHSGKWHLGGMREEQRKDRANDDSTGSRNTSPSWTDQRAPDILS